MNQDELVIHLGRSVETLTAVVAQLLKAQQEIVTALQDAGILARPMRSVNPALLGEFTRGRDT